MTAPPPDRTPRPSRLPLLTGRLPLETETCVFLLVGVLDILCTYLLLWAGGHRESNPAADYFLARYGVKGLVWFKMALAAFVCVLAQLIARKKPKLGRFVLLLGTAVTGAVVVYSVGLILRAG